jgi:hypothetical protein
MFSPSNDRVDDWLKGLLHFLKVTGEHFGIRMHLIQAEQVKQDSK